ncbi:TPA: hypothetical protein MDT58_005472 [Klebsiella pneumoniae]|uniref:hypothetical protein n=1 Tax=Klebsiella pneumoniae TaxID=573 RepID=UPI000E2BB131|nr:hypothetical protein [Klebsiella pneumoniae]SWF77552.1 Uncharacterised protein [Klebsiella pneumoniae]SWF87770.1 Uncharacterised protein [Klebsiella pneumoniae]HBQ1003998.1 hypothetical protein [Klebsiella pneumoniae]HBV2767965.1 hypothetical protein [Klebsiella pneumoniae]HBV4211643.1 hypothetical protein [Klebsiella pneumoniae]
MNPKSLKEIIDTTSGMLTGVLSTMLLYLFKSSDSLGQFKELIPFFVGLLVLLLSLLLIALNKSKIDKKKDQKTIEYKKEIKEKIETCSKIIKEEKDDSVYRKVAEENLASLLKKDMQLLDEIEMERAALNRDSEESVLIISSYMEKIKSTVAKQSKGKESKTHDE